VWESNIPRFNEGSHYATLLTASATTGWLDWIHGELWLFPDGLLRIPLGLIATILHGMGPTVNSAQPVQCSFDDQAWEILFASRKNNIWVPREAIQVAYLHRGMGTDRLRLLLRDQRSVKFLWFPWDRAWEPLQIALRGWLGDGLILD
jgi:hypothetical protein